MSIKDALGKRMKENYEYRNTYYLQRRTPVIIRLDGVAFHTFTRRCCEKPFDMDLMDLMNDVTRKLCNYIQGTKCAYHQSDEISILVTDFDRLTTEAFFDYNLSKICSVCSGYASAFFNLNTIEKFDMPGWFDCRAFNLPESEVTNYFIWRQADWQRNAVNMVAQANFSAKKLHGKNITSVKEMLSKKGINWEDFSPTIQNGTFHSRDESGNWVPTSPIFKKNRDIIENLLIPIED